MSFKDLFGFNKKERIGILSLSALLILMISGYFFFPGLLPPVKEMSDNEFKEEVEKFMENREKQRKEWEAMQEKKRKEQRKNDIRKTKELTPFPFNPNDLPTEKWKALGFGDKQIEIIKNYEKSGGEFRRKGDLRRIYGIDEDEYNQLAPYIRIPFQAAEESDVSPEDDYTPEKKEKILVIELNSADSAELRKIYGIGPAFSSRIVKFRDILGGYYKKEQLLEVYGLDSANYQQIKQHISVDASRVKTININTASFKELLSHPYLDYYLVKEITEYRESQGPFSDISELKEIPLIYDDLYNKITPYLSTQ